MKKAVIGFFLLSISCIGFGQQTINGSIMHDGLERDYILYVPESYNPATAIPLLFNFHGYTSSAYAQMIYGNFRPIADTAGFIIVHPQGTVDILGNTHWNVGWGTSTVDDVGFTEALIDSLSASYNINSERIYSTGMSNGGFMSYTLACSLSDRIAAIASVTGSMSINLPNSCSPEHPMPAMEIHGTADEVVPYSGSILFEPIEAVLDYWTGYNNCSPDPIITDMPDIDPNDGSTVEHHLYEEGDNGVEVEHFKVLLGGHKWPGSAIGGTGTNYDIDASAEVWRFFSKYDINGLIVPTGLEQLGKIITLVNIYPNPARSFITIELEDLSHTDFELTTLAGKKLAAGTIVSQNYALDLNGLPQGMYLLKIENRTYKILKH